MNIGAWFIYSRAIFSIGYIFGTWFGYPQLRGLGFSLTMFVNMFLIENIFCKSAGLSNWILNLWSYPPFIITPFNIYENIMIWLESDSHIVSFFLGFVLSSRVFNSICLGIFLQVSLHVWVHSEVWKQGLISSSLSLTNIGHLNCFFSQLPFIPTVIWV